MFFRSICLIVVTTTVWFISSANAHDYDHDNFHVDHPWARPTFALATTGAVYLTLANTGGISDTITGASVPESIAREAQLHDVIMDGDIMRMRHLEQGIEVQPESKVEFAPSGKHVMLLGLTGPLKLGQEFSLTLHFADADDLSVVVYVEQPEKSKAHSHHQHH